MKQPIHGPHAHSNSHLPVMMYQVLLALTPATLYGFWLYGWPAFNLWLVCLSSALVWEAVFLRLFNKPVKTHLFDGSALVTGWLLALCLPPWAPWWIAVTGTFLAVAMLKQIFGGLGQNVFNPAMAARVMLLIAFPVEMTQWVAPAQQMAQRPSFSAGLQQSGGQSDLLDSYSGATLLDSVKQRLAMDEPLSEILQGYDDTWLTTLLGSHAGSFGESSALLLMLGGLFLLWRGVITWQAPVGLMLGLVLPALVLNRLYPDAYPGALFHLFTGGAMLAAWFIVTDPVTAPATASGRFIFGRGCGLLAYLIRTFGNYPEGIAFAVMLMNSAVPVIDRYVRPRIYGRSGKGQPLPVQKMKTGERL